MRINTLFLALLLCVAPYANALIVSVQGHGEIPTEGMEFWDHQGSPSAQILMLHCLSAWP